jgi:hypothetical protein
MLGVCRRIHPSGTRSVVSGSDFRLALLGVILLFCAAARADIFSVTFTNVTFSETCIGGGGTCTEVINGSGDYDSVSQTASLISIDLTGTALSGHPYVANFNSFGSDAACASSPGSTTPPYLYDSGANPSDCAIQFNPTVDLTATGPTNLGSGSLLFIPTLCGGDQTSCGQTGDFPVGDFEHISGTSTSVDLGPSPVPEPTTFFPMLGLGVVFLLLRRQQQA